MQALRRLGVIDAGVMFKAGGVGEYQQGRTVTGDAARGAASYGRGGSAVTAFVVPQYFAMATSPGKYAGQHEQ